jgi:NarL family two-component system response regulator LiaR
MADTDLNVASGNDRDVGTWPTRGHGPSEREAEVLALVTEGYTNQEIAERYYLSIDSVKTHIRSVTRVPL